MRKAALLVFLALALSGCSSDWQDVAVVVKNDGPATTVEVVLDPNEGKTRTFTYHVDANGTAVDQWTIQGGGQRTYKVTVRAGGLEATGTEEFCASHAFFVDVNATAISYEHRRGDGFTGC